jgi:membrane protein YqaA with SNARE-associated domain
MVNIKQPNFPSYTWVDNPYLNPKKFKKVNTSGQKNIKNFFVKLKEIVKNIFSWINNHKYIKKIVELIVIILLIWILFIILKRPAMRIIESYDWTWFLYTHIKYQIVEKTYLGLFYAAIISGLFFSAMPIEIISIYYFINGYNPILIITLIVTGFLISITFNYFLGLLFGTRILKYFLKDKFMMLEEKISKYGGWLLFGSSLIIAPVDIFATVCGGLKYPYKRMIKIIFAGEITKYTFIYYFSSTITPYITKLF